jgi:hypothetical protein
MDGEVRRKLKEWAIALIIPLMLLAAWWSVESVNARNSSEAQAVRCKIEAQNIEQLRALKQISRELGLPGDFIIPERSEICIALDGP